MVQSPLPLEILPALVLYLLGLFALSYAIATDARARDVRFATVLGVVAAVFGIVALVYLLTRDSYGARTRPPSRRERGAWTYFVAMFVSMILSAVLGPPDPITQALYFPGFILVTLPLAYLVVFQNPWHRLKTAVR